MQTSESNYYSTKDALKDRYLRKVELLQYCSLDILLDWDRIASYLSGKNDALNRGNSLRTMKGYLVEWALGDAGKFQGDMFSVTEHGKTIVATELKRLEGKLKPNPLVEKELRELKENRL